MCLQINFSYKLDITNNRMIRFISPGIAFKNYLNFNLFKGSRKLRVRAMTNA